MKRRPASRPPRKPKVKIEPISGSRTHATSSRVFRYAAIVARVCDVPLHAHRERLESEQHEPSVHRRHLRTDVAQHFGARAHQKRVLGEGLGENLAW